MLLQAHLLRKRLDLLRLRLVLVVVKTVHSCLEYVWFLHPRGLRVPREKEKVVANLSPWTRVNQKAEKRVNPNLQRKAKANGKLLKRVKVDLCLKTKENLKAKEKNVPRVVMSSKAKERNALKVVTNLKARMDLKVLVKTEECHGMTILKEKGNLGAILQKVRRVRAADRAIDLVHMLVLLLLLRPLRREHP
jgi:hypothetical protein